MSAGPGVRPSFTSASLAPASAVRTRRRGRRSDVQRHEAMAPPIAPALAATVTYNALDDAPARRPRDTGREHPAVLSAAEFSVSDFRQHAFTFASRTSRTAHSRPRRRYLGPATSFTSAQLSAGDGAVVHDGGEAAPTFSLLRTMGRRRVHRSRTGQLTNVNDTLLTSASLTVAEGARTVCLEDSG